MTSMTREAALGVVGRVLEIQRMSTEDGPGLRTTLFLKGCSLRCRWCHNPESIDPRPQPRWTATRCLGCGACVAACPRGALSLGPDGVAIDRSRCDGCGACAAECPATAIELWGVSRDSASLARELLKDEAYFGDDGGVTVSGGEACLQPRFVADLLSRLKASGVGTALDTCGACSAEQFDEAAEYADLILYDLKDSDPERHRRNVGGELDRVRANFRRALGMVRDRGKRLWVRTPIIPGLTDSEDNVRGVAAFLAREAAGLVERWELCAFNNLCSGKYRSLGRAWELEGAPLKRAEEMGALVGSAVAEGWPADRVRWTGMTRRES